MEWLSARSTGELVLLIVGGFVALSVVSALLTSLLLRLGIHTPFGVRVVNGLRDRIIGLVKRPITIMVLDEVADVIQTGHYTRNISDAIIENHQEIKTLVTEKVRQDPNVRLVQRLPGYDTIVSTATETTLRVLIEMLGDPRMDELVSDLLRNNLQQIKQAVRDNDHQNVEVAPADITPDELRRRRPG